jgi:acetyl esterase/lipase
VAELDKQNVDPALWPLVESFPPIDLGPDTLPGFRAAMVELSVVPDPASHADIRIDTVCVPGPGSRAQDIRCLLYRPLGGSAGALLHIHGGGFVMGMPEMDAARNIELARATGCTILSVDYRLAPEHPYPAALEDCHAALLWLVAQSDSMGFAATRIGVIGESAGGGLAAALAPLARDSGAAALACQALIYPMLVPPGESRDDAAADSRTGRCIWTRTSNSYCWSTYLAGAAMHKASLAGLPPTFVAVGDLDLFVHDNLAHAGRLLAAGCSVEAHVYPGAIHGFDRMVDAPVSLRYTRELVAFIRRHLG